MNAIFDGRICGWVESSEMTVVSILLGWPTMKIIARLFVTLAMIVSATWFVASTVVVRADEPADALTAPPKPGRFTLTIKSGGFERVVHIQIPEGYKSEAKPPLVLLLHGAGGSGLGILDKDGWAAKADK